ncbi:MAG: hydrogenase nickel incorporation protein HypB [Chloroflexota bacterium]
MKVELLTNVMSVNDRLADENRRHFDEHGFTVVNLMGSPGAGKTSLVMRTIAALKGQQPIAVVEGDIASSIDADDVAATGTPVVQINTGGTCHLDANMISQAAGSLTAEPGSLVFIENVGNLVCPASYRLGEHIRAVVLGATEGSDKPFKYPKMFVDIDVVVVNKLDLAGAVDFERGEFIRGVRALTRADIIEVSCRTGEGIEEWTRWLTEHRAKRVERGA